MGQRMEEVIPGLYEMVVTRTDAINRTQAYFHTCPHLEEFRTSDLFAPIPGSEGWWIFHGRTDNWITMSNGFKMDPTAIENTISAHPRVMGALVAGSHQFRLCLLVELRPEFLPKSDEEREKILDEMWPTIAEANKSAPKFGRVPRELVLFASAAKPFSRSSKGSVQRRLTIAAHEAEIGDVYAKIGDGLLPSGLPPLRSATDADAMRLFLTAVFAETLDLEDLTADEDLFAKGLDSLSIFLLTARIKAGLRAHHGISDAVLNKVDYTLLYTSPTISQLAERLLSLILPSGSDDGPEDRGSTRSGVDDVHDLLAKYTAMIPEILQRNNNNALPKDKDKDKQKHTIVLTGSRGSLGSYILSELLARPDVAKIYCLNRRAVSAADQHHIASFKARGLPDLEPQLDRVVFLQTNLAAPNLGLGEGEKYAALAAEATAIIHNAWPVNFVMPVRSFEPQIQGLMNLFQLAQDGVSVGNSSAPAPVLFVSSIAAAVPFSTESKSSPGGGIVQESVLGDEDGALVQPGYGQSKFICEKLLERYVASSSGRGRGAILRVGQVCGPLEGPGTWNPWEWAPSMILSSKYLGVAPDSIGPADIDWIPVDVLGRVVCELVDAAQPEDDVVVYNVQNPRVTTWRELLPAVRRVVPETVAPADWIGRLEASSHVADRNPGVKLVDFYKRAFLADDGLGQGAIVTEKRNLLRGSRTAREMGPVKAEDLEKWMMGWGLS